MSTSGSLRGRYTFARRAPDANGDATGAWQDVITCSVEVAFLRGTETVQAARLQGARPALLTVRACQATRSIDNAWRATDSRDGSGVFDVVSAELTPDRAWVQILTTTKARQANV